METSRLKSVSKDQRCCADSEPRDLPKTLAGFRDYHLGESILVCGCGQSLRELPSTDGIVTIGVNDVGRLFQPDYLVVLNRRSQFSGDRFSFVESSRARAIFTQLDLDIDHPDIVRFRLGRRSGTDLSDPDTLPYAQNSPYVALCLAAYMGAKRIGLIGVDFTDHHFFAKTGRHSLAGKLNRIDGEYEKLSAALTRQGVEVVNLSSQSRLTAFPKMPLEKFLKGNARRDGPESHSIPLNIVSYATTPVAGVPAILARCIDKKTPHACECVWASDSYGNGVRFGGGISWRQSPRLAEEALDAADVVVVHNGKVAAEHRAVLENKAVITMAHNYIWNVDRTFVEKGYPGVVVGQYQATLPELRDWQVVPNPLPFWEPAYSAAEKGSRITICYTPSGKHESYPKGHRLYWHAKGYKTTMQVLERLACRYPIRLEVIRNRQLSHDRVLAMKRRSHIVIDECATGSYHRSSLEGLAMRCVVVNGVGLLPGVGQMFRQCTGTAEMPPFVKASLDDLEYVLAGLIEKGREWLQIAGENNRNWMERHWSFATQWDRFWSPAVEHALATSGRSGATGKVSDGGGSSVARSRPRQPALNPERLTVADLFPKGGSGGKDIPVYWTCRGSRRGNFGDMLSPILVKALARRPAAFATQGPRLFAVGSLLKFAHRGDVVWGSGFIDAEDACPRGLHVCAVRGPLTRQKLHRLGVECPETYGDPGLLLPWIHPRPAAGRKGIGIIPHYVDAARIRKAIRDPEVRIIDVRAGVDAVIAQATRCELLLSSSLHGCVLGDAYGIPTVWVRVSDQVVGNGFKFRDYYAGTGREPVCVDWRQRIDLDGAVGLALKAPPVRLDLAPLLHSFPALHEDIQVLDDIAPHGTDLLSTEAFRKTSRPIGSPLRISGSCSTTPVVAAKEKRARGGEERTTQAEPRIAVFSAGNEGYAPYMVTSLCSFMRCNVGRPFDYYILGQGFSAPTRCLLERWGIRYLELDLGRVFLRRAQDSYPSECFWIFRGPELFVDMGYPYSLSVDGDTWCNRRLDVDWLSRTKHLAGIDRGCSVETFLTRIGQYRKLEALFGIPAEAGRRVATNTGVIFYRNAALREAGFFDRVVEVYQRSEAAGIHRAGDDSTLALLMAVHPDIELFVLEQTWNAYRDLQRRFKRSESGYARHLAHWIDEARIVHHIQNKPWMRTARFPNRTVRHFHEQWQALWRDVFESRSEPGTASPIAAKTSARSMGPRLKASAREFPVLCYWYRGDRPNLGDETVPYLVPKIAGLAADARLRRRPLDPRRVGEPVLLSVGSVLRLCGSGSVVWGTGIRNIDQAVARARRFCAVRGPLTRRRLLQLGYECPAIYGDPALLLPRFYCPDVEQRYRLGIIPHILDYADLSKRYGGYPDVLVIDVATTDVEAVIRQILSCRCTASSTLHGLVLSVAYGIPTRWLRCRGKIMGDDTKFYDFFASLEPLVMESLDTGSVTLPLGDPTLAPYHPVHLVGATIPPDELADRTFAHALKVDLERLMEACPIDRSGWKDGLIGSAKVGIERSNGWSKFARTMVREVAS